MNKLKIITHLFIYISSVLILSAYTVDVTENQMISKQKKHIVTDVSGIYEFETSWLQSTVNLNPMELLK